MTKENIYFFKLTFFFFPISIPNNSYYLNNHRPFSSPYTTTLLRISQLPYTIYCITKKWVSNNLAIISIKITVLNYSTTIQNNWWTNEWGKISRIRQKIEMDSKFACLVSCDLAIRIHFLLSFSPPFPIHLLPQGEVGERRLY